MPNFPILNPIIYDTPIVLFVYNRPNHTKVVLDALAKNIGSEDTELYIFCDGPKLKSDNENILNIEKVQNICLNEKRFKKVHVNVKKINYGLSKSIITGVTEVINIHEKVIVLEDDIVPNIGFIQYMNQALTLYKNVLNVGCIHAWNYSIDYKKIKHSTFFLPGGDCWGWGTWLRAWNKFNIDGKSLLNSIRAQNLIFRFERNGTHNFVKMLEDQINAKNDSWAVRWHASLVLNNMYCLFPTRPIVCNIGLDNSGTHCGNFNWTQNTVDTILVEKIEVNECTLFYKLYKKYLFKQKFDIIQTKIKKLFIKDIHYFNE